MIEFQISTEPATIISFDGRVIELFWMTARQSGRFHVFQISKIWISTDKHGVHSLNMTSKYAEMLLIGGLTISENALVQTQDLVQTIQQAAARYA